jgi:hypothetical protein
MRLLIDILWDNASAMLLYGGELVDEFNHITVSEQAGGMGYVGHFITGNLPMEALAYRINRVVQLGGGRVIHMAFLPAGGGFSGDS